MKTVLTKNDATLFAQAMEGVQPIKADFNALTRKSVGDDPGVLYRRQKAEFYNDEVSTPLSLILRNKLSKNDWLSFKRNGIQTGVFKNLRTGKYCHEATLNLNRMSPMQARDKLLQFVDDCQEMNIRSVLIYFGQESGNLIKSYLAQWLPELDNVQAFHTALKHHGGSSAVYVLFRKSEQKRMENRERHAARRGKSL